MRNKKLFPAKIKICGIPYRVLYFQSVKAVNANPEGENLEGQISFINHEVRIHQQPVLAMYRVLLHEIIHGIAWEMGITDYISEEHGEKVTDNLALGMLHFLRDNKVIDFG